MRERNSTFTLRLAEDLKAILQALAAKENRTLSGYIEMLLERHIAELAQNETGLLKIAMTAFAQRELEQPNFINHLLQKHLDADEVTEAVRLLGTRTDSAAPKKK
jgi:predicted transcriptional regulator